MAGVENFQRSYKNLELAAAGVEAEIALYGQVESAPEEYHQISRDIRDVQRRVADIGWPEDEEAEDAGEVSNG